ncbi:MAG: carbon-nitrogen family hydrolase [Geopsychrobacter sp.]|nr:carbon-nitrogen family hydrolase [Geopsychrobacter sp.]
MSRKFNAAVLQFNINPGALEINLAKGLSALKRVASKGAQLAVLPEMWSCAYDYRRLAKCAAQSPWILEEWQRTCHETGLVSVGSLPEADAGQIYNTAYVIDRGEIVGAYRKLHLFSMMKEDRFLAAGASALVVETSVGRLGIAICYDLRFGELFRKLAMAGAEIICLPAEWPKPRQEHWNILLRARAIENQLFVAAANCCGVQGPLDFFGQSQLISPLGNLLATSGAEETELIAEFDFAEMERYRRQIDVFGDRRADIYGTP